MKYIRLVGLLAITLLSGAHSFAQEVDNPGTLEWVLKTTDLLEKRLNDAVSTPDAANLLIKLMESYEDFEAVALAGLYCHEVRAAAEQGRNYCNWLTNYRQEKDLNALVVRAQNARVQAIRMRDEASVCLQEATQRLPDASFTLADVIRANAKAIEYDLADGLASQNFHILSQKLEHAERIFHDTEVLAARLDNCETVGSNARQGIQACANALASPNWTLVTIRVQEAAAYAAKIMERAGECR